MAASNRNDASNTTFACGHMFPVFFVSSVPAFHKTPFSEIISKNSFHAKLPSSEFQIVLVPYFERLSLTMEDDCNI